MGVGVVISIACAVFVIGLVGSILLLTGQPDQATVRIDEATGELVVRPIGLMRLWAFSSGVRAPLAGISGASVLDRADNAGRYWRPSGLGGPRSYIPGVICAGTYRRSGVRELWMVAKSTTAVAVEFADQKYARVVVQVADPPATVALVTAATHA